MTSSLIYRSMCGFVFNFLGCITKAGGRSTVCTSCSIFCVLKVSRYSGDFWIIWYVVLVIDTTLKSVVLCRK